MSAPAQTTPAFLPRRPARRETVDSARNSTRLRTSPIFQRAVRDAAAYQFARGAEGEISALVRESLRRQWPGVTESDIDYVLCGRMLAVESEAATYREGMRNALEMGQRAGREAWEEVA